MDDQVEPIRILHADDEPGFADTVGTFLERSHPRTVVDTAVSASAGMAALDRAAYDCVISDYNMADSNGLEFLEAVREIDPDIPFILFTGNGSEGVASEAISAGVSDYLQKRGGTDQYAVLANRVTTLVERHRAERERDRMRTRIETALAHTGSVLFEIDLDDETVVRHGSTERTFAHPGSAVSTVAEYVDRAVHPADRDAVRTMYRELIDGNRRSGTVLYWTAPDEDEPAADVEVRWVEDTVSIAERSTRAGHVAIGIARDVTDRTERERRFDAIFNNTYEFTGFCKPDGTLLEANETALQFGGLERADVVGSKLWEAEVFQYSPETARLAREAVERAADGEFVRRDLTVQGADRTAIIDFSIRPLTDDQGTVTHLIPEGRDVTDSRSRERELRTMRLEGEAAVDVGLVGTWEWHVPTDSIVTSSAFATTFGVDPAAAAEGVSIDSFLASIDERDRERVETSIDAALEGCGSFHEEYRVSNADGERRWVSARGEVQCDESGTPIRFAGAGIDVTERKHREERLQRQNERLEEFAGILSHDIRNPLQVAEGRLALAREDCQSDHLDDIEMALTRIHVLIEDLLALARDGDDHCEQEIIDLSALAQMCWQTVDTAEATLVVDADADARIVGDRNRLSRLFENLYRNAVDHAGSTVTVTVEALESGFVVADDGPGIPRAERDAIFDLGYTTTETGTGFGLTIVSRIADAHGWSLTVTDGHPDGVRFEFSGVEVVEAGG